MSLRISAYQLLFCFLLTTNILTAQEIFYKKISIDYGIPSSSVYDIAEDKLGFLWLATESGVSRYDGIKFVNFNVSDGIPQLPFVKIAQNNQQELLFLSRSGLIYVYNYRRFKLYPTSLKLSNLIENETVDNIVCLKNNDIIVSTTKGNVFRLNSDYLIQINDGSGESDVLFFTVKDNQYIWGKVKNKNYKFSNELNVLHPGDTFIFKMPHQYQVIDHKTLCMVNPKYNELIITFENRFYHIGQYKNYMHLFKNPINDVVYDKSGNIWVAEANNGCYFYPDGKMQESPEHFLQNRNILKIFQDHENGYWLLVDNDGVYYISDMNFRIYPELDFDIISLDTFKNFLYFVTYDQKIYRVEKLHNKLSQPREIILPDKGKDLYEDILCFSDGTLWILRSVIYRDLILKNEKLVDLVATQYFLNDKNQTGPIQASVVRKVKFKDQQVRYFYPNGIYRGKPFSLFEDLNGTLWIHTLEGLMSEYGSEIRYYLIENQDLKKETTDYEFSRGINWIGTRSQGLKMIMNTGTIMSFGAHADLYGGFIRDVYIDMEFILWLGTNEGITKINLGSDNYLSNYIKNLTKISSVPYHEINEILRDKEQIWVGCSQGLMTFIPEKFQLPPVFPMLRLRSVRVNDQDTFLLQEFKLKPYQNTLAINYEAVSFREKNVYFRYRMKGLDGKWLITRNNSIRFPKLLPGEYVFEIMPSYSGNTWPLRGLKISFVIEKPFYQKFWFILLVILVILLIIIGILWIIIRNVRKSNEKQKNMLLAEISALRSQMNPHFLFNSINILQDFILDGNFKDSLLYLNDLSRLLRMILEASRFHLIFLSKELEIIELFIQIIRMRYVNDFISEIKFENIQPESDIVIPPMIVQPFIENAVFHGLKLKEGEKRLEIVFSKVNEEYMQIKIEDNGIGRVKSQEMKKNSINKHRPIGMMNIFDRINLINQLQEKKMECKIIDLYDENKVACGTRVELLIPIMTKKYELRFAEKHQDSHY